MKISKAWEIFHEKYPFQLKIFKKWIFWILLDYEAFFVAKYVCMKLTPHDKQHIKVWFPISSEKKRLGELQKKWLGYILIDKMQDPSGEVIRYSKENISGKYYNTLLQINLEDYELTKQRILWLWKLWLEEQQPKTFLLKDKIEDLYLIISQRLIKMPKIERRYFREKIEKMMINLLGYIYEYMYIPATRSTTIKKISESSLIIREYTRFLYKLGKIKNDNVFLDTGEKWLEIMKITKTLQNKHQSEY